MPKWINLLFLSFATAAAGEAFFFTFIDPKLLYLFGEPVNWSPTVVLLRRFLHVLVPHRHHRSPRRPDAETRQRNQPGASAWSASRPRPVMQSQHLLPTPHQKPTVGRIEMLGAMDCEAARGMSRRFATVNREKVQKSKFPGRRWIGVDASWCIERRGRPCESVDAAWSQKSGSRAYFGSHFQMISNSTSGSTGLVTKSFIPAARHLRRSSEKAFAVSAMIGVCRSGRCSRIR